jgi:hypothetical protein
MELSVDEKQAILNQRVKQFAAEKFNHEINKTLLSEQKKTAKEEAKAELDVEIAKTDEAIAIIDKAIETTQGIEASLPVEAKVEAEVVEPVQTK